MIMMLKNLIFLTEKTKFLGNKDQKTKEEKKGIRRYNYDRSLPNYIHL